MVRMGKSLQIKSKSINITFFSLSFIVIIFGAPNSRLIIKYYSQLLLEPAVCVLSFFHWLIKNAGSSIAVKKGAPATARFIRVARTRIFLELIVQLLLLIIKSVIIFLAEQREIKKLSKELIHINICKELIRIKCAMILLILKHHGAKQSSFFCNFPASGI